MKSQSLPSPKELCYFWFVPEWNNFQSPKKGEYWKKAIKFYLKTAFLILKQGAFHNKNISPSFSTPLIVVLGTKNHLSVFESFKEYIKIPYTIWGNSGEPGKAQLSFNLPQIPLMQKIAIWLHLMFHELLKQHRLEKPFHYKRNEIFQTYLKLLEFEKIFHTSKASCVLIFNDHSPLYRAILYAAKKTKVKTIYIPHASVSIHFPPLVFDYALLEGEDMAEKYQKKEGNTAQIMLVGNPKIDEASKGIEIKKKKKKKKNETLFTIGVAYNLLDSIDLVEKLVKNLIFYFSKTNQTPEKYRFILRPHPGVNRKIILEHSLLTYSDPYKEGALEFIQRIDLLVSGPSNIILESLMLSTPAVQFKFSENENFDPYGFIKEGLISEPFDSAHTLINEILKIQKDGFFITAATNEKLRYFNAAIGSNFEGKVGITISNRIEQITRGEE